eukprot:812440_1
MTNSSFLKCTGAGAGASTIAKKILAILLIQVQVPSPVSASDTFYNEDECDDGYTSNNGTRSTRMMVIPFVAVGIFMLGICVYCKSYTALGAGTTTRNAGIGGGGGDYGGGGGDHGG